MQQDEEEEDKTLVHSASRMRHTPATESRTKHLILVTFLHSKK